MKANIQTILDNKIILIVRGIGGEKLLSLAKACYEGGIRVMECTYDATKATPWEENAANIRLLKETFGDKMLIGAGTVLYKEQIALTKEAGGQFIVSPNVKKEIIEETKREDLVSIPGCLTPSESVDAWDYGADFIKLFPIGAMPDRYLKDLTAPLSHIRFLAVGGVTEKNMATYQSAGACGFGIGVKPQDRIDLEAGHLSAITERMKVYVSLAKGK